LLNGEEDPAEVIRRVGRALLSAPITWRSSGIGENGHLGVQRSSCRLRTEEPYIVVTLTRPAGASNWEKGGRRPRGCTTARHSMSVRQIFEDQ